MSFDGVSRQLDRLLVLLTGLLIVVAAIGVAVLPPGTATPRGGPDAGEVSTVSGIGPKARGVRPTGLEIPSIELRAPVVRIEVSPDGVLDPPAALSVVGWWQRSARAGAASGQSVLTGHSASSAEGVMDDMAKVPDGAKVFITTPRTRVEYVVTGQVELTQEQLARQAVKLFGQDRKRNRLVLVTCSDYRNGVWNKNIIVFADPVKVSKRSGRS